MNPQNYQNKQKMLDLKLLKTLYNTGACVLTQPSMERGLLTYIINILIQIKISANEKKIKFIFLI